MKKILCLLAALVLPLSSQAQTTQAFNTFVTGLSAASTPTGTELVPCIQGGTTKKCTALNIATTALAGLTLEYLSTPQSIYFGTSVASASAAGQDNTTFGVSAGTNLAASGITQAQGDTLIGWQAGQAMTTGRETVAIGYRAFSAYTGSGDAAEDGTMVAIGSFAAYQVAAVALQGTGSVVIGQKGAETATALLGVVVVGSHSDDSATSSNGDVIIGNGTVHNQTGGTVTTQNNVIIGTGALGNVGTGSITNNVIVGANITPAMTGGATDNVIVGPFAGGCTTCGNIVAVGYDAGNAIGAGMNDVFVGGRAGVSSTGTGQTLIGYNAGQAATVGLVTAIGLSSCYSVIANNDTCIGYQAGINMTGGANTIVGQTAGFVLSTGSNNTIIGSSVAVGTLTTGSSNILIGTSSGTTTVAAATSSEINIGGALIGYSIAPTLTSGFGTSPTAPTQASTFSFSATVGATGTPSSATVIGLATAPAHWNCSANDLTTNLNARMTLESTTSVTITWSAPATGTATAPSNGDVLWFKCLAN